MKTKDWVVNALVAALYLVLTAVLSGLAFGAVQFRISEILNHLAVYNKKYIVGIVAGVVVSNLFLSPMLIYDLFFGVAHSLMALVFMRLVTRPSQSEMLRMMVNTASFALFSFMIAIELKLAFEAPFFYSWFTVALGEIVVMFIGAPIMKAINKQINFSKQVSE